MYRRIRSADAVYVSFERYQTRVTYRYNFETRPRFFSSEVRNRLEHLKRFLECASDKG